MHALRDVSLTLAEHEFVVLLGPSGSGKSTRLNVLGGLDVPTGRRPALNDLYLRSGDWVDATRPDVVLASEALLRGQRIHDRRSGLRHHQWTQATPDDRRHRAVTGIRLRHPPGEVVPDPKRFAALWMERRTLASAFDMEGGFNDVSLGIGPGGWWRM